MSGVEIFWVALSIFLLGMSKGGFPVGVIALPLLILVWPEQAQAGRRAVAFMLPMLCVMDVVAVAFYRRHIAWRRLWVLLPGSLAGVVVGSILFVSDSHSLLAVSDRALKICIGVIGLLFCGYQASKKWLLRRLDDASRPGLATGSLFGVSAGITSTLAHAAGPLIQMYLLPQRLSKKQFAGTLAAYFFVLNLVKMVPFIALGRIRPEGLHLGLRILPVIPLGVAAGYGLVHVMKSKHYVVFIYAVLFVTSCLLIARALGAGL